jgi:hypothetical protein
LFKAMGASQYPYPGIVIFSANVRSGCGTVSAAMGPFYCPADLKVYLDSAFLGNLFLSVGAPGQFSQAYLIAHEVGHHVQNVLGTMRQLNSQSSLAGEQQQERLKVRLELQADCYTGVWVYYVEKRNLLEPGDLDEGLPAALAFGDARTRGTTEQRMSWFKRGLATGDPRQCDTFAINQP